MTLLEIGYYVLAVIKCVTFSNLSFKNLWKITAKQLQGSDLGDQHGLDCQAGQCGQEFPGDQDDEDGKDCKDCHSLHGQDGQHDEEDPHDACEPVRKLEKPSHGVMTGEHQNDLGSHTPLLECCWNTGSEVCEYYVYLVLIVTLQFLIIRKSSWSQTLKSCR